MKMGEELGLPHVSGIVTFRIASEICGIRSLNKPAGCVRRGSPSPSPRWWRASDRTAAYPGAKALIKADGTLAGWVGGSCAQPTVIQEALKALADGQARLLRISPEPQHSTVLQEGVYDFVMTCASQGALEIFVEPFLPRPELLVIGETPVAQALARFGALVDFTVCVSDPAATKERFPDAATLYTHLEAVRAQVNPRSYVVIATQEAYDEEALAAVIDTPACYIGLVASGKRAATIFQYLRDRGCSQSCCSASNVLPACSLEP